MKIVKATDLKRRFVSPSKNYNDYYAVDIARF